MLASPRTSVPFYGTPAESANYTVSTFVNSCEEGVPNTHAKRIEELQQKAIGFIYPENYKMRVLAIRARDVSSNKDLAYLYAIAVDKIFSLEYLFVKDTARNSGIGSILYKEAFKTALLWNMEKITLCTYEFQAPKFYEKLGFIRTSQILNALDGHSLIYLERVLKNHAETVFDKPTSELQFEIFTVDTFNPIDLYREPKTEIRKIYDEAIAGLMQFNARFLESQDRIPRVYLQFSVCLIKQKTDKIVAIIGGLILLGKLSGTIMMVDLFGYNKDFEFNKNSFDAVDQALIELGHTYQCKALVAYEKNVEEKLERIGFSPKSSPPLTKITPILN